jgi:4-amino-4-deoxy-L-arabinose transferase-like glycosyltransferase
MQAWQKIGALALCLWAFFMAAWVSRSVFERLPHLEDEVAYLYQARIVARGNLTIDTPQPRQAFWQPFVIDDATTGQRFGKYSIGYPLVLGVGEAMGQAWLVNALAGALAVALAFRATKTLFGAPTALISACLLAFSPMALLLNGTLMAHSVALVYALAFMWAYWQIDTTRAGEAFADGTRPRYAWGALAGVALGLLLITRPFTTVAVALPFVLWGGLRLVRALMGGGVRGAWLFARPYALLGAIALAIGALTPLFHTVATGNPRANLYTRVWSYDTVGFGECCGRNVHTLEKGFRHARFDLSLAASDLFGWEVGTLTDAHITHLQTRANYWLNTGLSFIPLGVGFVLAVLWGIGTWREGARRALGASLWLAGAIAWCVVPLAFLPTTQLQNPSFSWAWIILGVAWVLFPLFALAVFNAKPRTVYVWLWLAVLLGIVVWQMAYWIGSQRYSTRYWYEAIGVACAFGALPFAVFMRGRVGRVVVSAVVVCLCAYSLLSYSLPRVGALYRFNNVGQDVLDAVMARREGDAPLLVLIRGETAGENRIMWNAYAALTASTSPYLDGDMVAARVYGDFEARVRALFPERQVIVMEGVGSTLRFVEGE